MSAKGKPTARSRISDHARGSVENHDHTLATALLEALRAKTSDGIGVTRDSYEEGESAALDIIEAKAREFGLAAERDAAANLVATLGAREDNLPFVAYGSHLDSVPQGGNFHGAAGVVAGLMVLRRFQRSGFKPRQPVKLFACAAGGAPLWKDLYRLERTFRVPRARGS